MGWPLLALTNESSAHRISPVIIISKLWQLSEQSEWSYKIAVSWAIWPVILFWTHLYKLRSMLWRIRSRKHYRSFCEESRFLCDSANRIIKVVIFSIHVNSLKHSECNFTFKLFKSSEVAEIFSEMDTSQRMPHFILFVNANDQWSLHINPYLNWHFELSVISKKTLVCRKFFTVLFKSEWIGLVKTI